METISVCYHNVKSCADNLSMFDLNMKDEDEVFLMFLCSKDRRVTMVQSLVTLPQTSLKTMKTSFKKQEKPDIHKHKV